MRMIWAYYEEWGPRKIGTLFFVLISLSNARVVIIHSFSMIVHISKIQSHFPSCVHVMKYWLDSSNL